jgi:predicted nucleic acid-binding protein
MRLVIDASILVAEAVRRRGRDLLAHSLLDLFVAEPAWNEAQHEVHKRLTAMERYGHITADQRREIEDAAQGAVAVTVRQVPQSIYASVEAIARERIPRDPDDWPTVALALVLEAGIWTHDADFLGCGAPTWTVETLTAHVRRHGRAVANNGEERERP